MSRPIGVSRPSQPVQPVPSPANQASAAGLLWRSKLTTWLLLGLVLLVAAVPLVDRLDVAQVTDAREARALATSLQTFERHGPIQYEYLSLEDMTPYLNGRERLDLAPGLTWLHLGIFNLLPHDQIAPDLAVVVGRLASVILALVCLAAVFWAGYSLTGTFGAFMAALVCAANPLFLYHGRIVNVEIAFAALAVLSMAAALWAIRPLRPAPTVSRQVIGWTTCGVVASGALLTLGPGAGPIIALPVLVVVLVVPRRTGHLLGLVAATFIAALLVAPWAIFAHGREPDVWRWWAMDWILTTYWLDLNLLDIGAVAAARLLIFLAAMAPWTLWLMAAVAQPFSTSSGGERTRLFVAWSWLISVLGLFLAGPMIGRTAYLLLCLPAGAMLVAVVFDRFTQLNQQQRPARLWRTLRWPQVLLMAGASLAIPLCLMYQPRLIDAGWLPWPVTMQTGWMYAAGLMTMLLGLTLWSAQLAATHHAKRTLVAWAVWTLVLVVGLTGPMTRGPLARSQVRTEAMRLARLTDQSPAFWLQPEVGQNEPDPAMVLYANRPLFPIKPSQIDRVMAEYPHFYLIGTGALHAGLPQQAELVTSLPNTGLQLWRVEQATSVPPGEETD